MPEATPLTPLQLRIVWTSWIVGALARLLYVDVVHPATRFMFSDMYGYVDRARHFFDGHPKTIADTIYPPGASIFFGLLYKLDPAWNLSTVVQWLLSLGTMGLVWSLARRLYGTNVAIVALAMVALYFPLIHYAGLFLAENPFTFFMLLTLRLFVHAIEAEQRRRALAWAVLAGLCAGIAASFKTTILGPLAVTGLLYAGFSIKHRRPYWVSLSAAVLLGVATLVVPMSLHCTRLTEGKFCLAATNGPMNILQGHYGNKFMFHWHDSARNYYFNFGSPTASLRGYTESVDLPFGAYDAAANMKLVRAYIAEHPGAALLQSCTNMLDLFSGSTIWPQATLFRKDFGAVYQWLFWCFILLPAAVRIGLRWRPMMQLAADSLREWLLLGPVLGLMALAFIAEGEVRYRVPFDGLLIILAAQSYVALAQRLRRRCTTAPAHSAARLYSSASSAGNGAYDQ
ncbi:MAG: hypothetical protein JWR16_1656 [Nevskia sp.]|nr:hypothetical protein [Nevskia sp.]